jgi:cytochrome b6-f complex iron-sulfur subunit
MPANKEDGTNPEGHIWRIAPTRRDFVGFLGWGAVLTSIGIGTLAWVRLMYPRVLFEPPSQFKLDTHRYRAALGLRQSGSAPTLQAARFDDRFIAVSATCPHLGCTPRYLNTEDKFKVPLPRLGLSRLFQAGGRSSRPTSRGPAPRPLERFKLTLATTVRSGRERQSSFGSTRTRRSRVLFALRMMRFEVNAPGGHRG